MPASGRGRAIGMTARSGLRTPSLAAPRGADTLARGPAAAWETLEKAG
jgi:hypothetical protein